MALEPAGIGTRPKESKAHPGSTGNTPAIGWFPAPAQAPVRTAHSSGLRVHFCNVI